MAGPAVAGLVGASVSAGIAVAGTVAWVVTPSEAGSRSSFAPRTPASAPADAAQRTAGTHPVTLEQGRIYYVQLCIGCHGARGDGAGEWAYRVTPRPADLTAARTRARSDAQLLGLIGEPQPGTPMTGWKTQLSEPQLGQLVGYVRHLGQVAAAPQPR